MLGLIYATLSAFFMSVMVITDKLMVKNCYGDSKNSAWFISSLFGSVLGLIFTLLTWFTIALISPEGTFRQIVEAFLDLWYWQGIIITICGALAVQLLFHYFACFTENAPISIIAGWLAATPLFIYLASIVFAVISNALFEESYINVVISKEFFLGFIVAIISLISFEIYNNSTGSKTIKGYYGKHLFMIVLINIIYTIGIEYTLNFKHGYYSYSMYTLALLPYFWIGFAFGIRALTNESKRVVIKHYWKNNIYKFLPIIFVVEIVGMLVFYFEYFGLSKQSASTVSLIIGSHIILVYIFDLLISKEISTLKNKIINGILIFTSAVGIVLAGYFSL